MTRVESQEGQPTSHDSKGEMADNWAARKFHLPAYPVPVHGGLDSVLPI